MSNTVAGILLKGVAASRPAANAVTAGTIYSATDTGAITQSDGVSTWSTFATAGGMSNPMTTKGDVILGDTGGTPSRLAAGASGYILTSNGAAAFPSWQASTGPSIASGPWWAPWAGPSSPDATNAEFTGSQLAGMTHVYNSGAAKGAWLEGFSVASFKSTATGGNPELDVYAQSRTMSTGDYVEIAYRHTNIGTGFFGAFVGFADGTTFNNAASHVVGGFLHNSTTQYRVMLNTWDGYNTRTTDGTILDCGAQVGSTIAARVKYEAANTWGLYYSIDGKSWLTVQTNYAKTMTPSYVVFGVSMFNSAAANPMVSLEYFRVNS